MPGLCLRSTGAVLRAPRPALLTRTAIAPYGSDDRTKDVFDSRVYAVVGTHSIERAGRPNVLIVDEIDGCSRPAIDLLLSLAAGNKRKGSQGLRRPIICICNNQLRPRKPCRGPTALRLSGESFG